MCFAVILTLQDWMSRRLSAAEYNVQVDHQIMINCLNSTVNKIPSFITKSGDLL